MSPMHPWLLGLGLLLSAAEGPPPSAADPARLRELLLDRQHARNQSQAALLLVQSRAPEAEEVLRQALRQTNASETFFALTAALRLQRDPRFVDELFSALIGGQPAVRQAAAETLAELADAPVVRRLQALAEDARVDGAIRQVSVAALGRCGRREALVVLLDQLSNEDERFRQAAADALAELTGQTYGLDLARWRTWWGKHKDLSHEQWLEERLAYQGSRARRFEGELDQARAQIVRLHQQLYSRLPAGDRLGHVQGLAEAEDPAVRGLAVGWTTELWPTADAVGQRTLADLLYRFSYDGTPDVQRLAVLALGRVADPRAFDRLHALLQRGPAPVRAAAARALVPQLKGSSPEALARQRQAVPALQKALDDPALEVVVEAAESLGTLGVPEAGPVLTVLLRHPSRPVRQTAALALERVADLSILDGLLDALDDPAVTIRFSLVGALGHAAGDGRGLTEAQRPRLLTRLEGLLVRDADPGVRSRAATVLGECGPPAVLPTLWRRVLASEDGRVQDKAWAAVVEVLVRAGNLELLQEWDRALVEAKQGPRRLQLLTEAAGRWPKREETKSLVASVLETLVQAQLEQGKWGAAFPLVRDMLTWPATDAEREKRLRWLLAVGEQALKEGNRPEALRAVREAQPLLGRTTSLTGDFEKLERQAKAP